MMAAEDGTRHEPRAGSRERTDGLDQMMRNNGLGSTPVAVNPRLRPQRRAGLNPLGHVPSTSDLLVGCRAGDRASWAALVDRYETLVYAVARRNGLGPQDAADVTQSTFAVLLQHLDGLRDLERLAAWLAMVARRESWRVAKREKQEFTLTDENLGDADPVGDWEREEAVRQAMNQLGDPCRELLRWLFFDPVPPSQIELADRLGRAVGGIGPLRGRCLEKLRLLLEGDGHA